MKITMPNGFIFEGTQAEYDEFMAKLDAQYKALDETKEQPEETIEFEGEQYRKVDRKAQAGDVVIISKDDGRLPDWFTVGKSYKVTSKNGRTVIFDDVGDWASVYFRSIGRTPETVDVYEKVEAEYIPQEGDIVVVIANTSGSRNAVGDIGKITKVGSKRFKVNVPNGPKDNVWTERSDFRKATPAEVEAYEKAVAEASKPKLKAGDFIKFSKLGCHDDITLGKAYEVYEGGDGELVFLDDVGDERYYPLTDDDCEYEILTADVAKWAKIGRKPGEFKVGDIVVADRLCISQEKLNGHLGFVEDISENMVGIRFTNGRYCGAYTANNNVKLIAPVDARFNV